MFKRILLVASLAFIAPSSSAQENLTYQKPPKEILDLVDYERPPSILMDSKKENILLLFRNTYKTLDDLNQDELRLGGLRVHPTHLISSSASYINNIKTKKLFASQEQQVIGLPTQPKIANLSWSPDERKIAFTHTSDYGLELWILDVTTSQAKKVSTLQLNACMGNPITWYKDNNSLLVRVVPSTVAPLKDTKKDLPTGPIVSTADGKVSQNRTYQDLLKNKIDEYNFEQLTATELYKINIENGQATIAFPKGLYTGESFSPDGQYLLLTTIQKPFSYLVPYSRFPLETHLYSKEGKLISQVRALPLAEVMPKGFMAVRKGKRQLFWRDDKPATLVWVEALDNGDPAMQVSFRDAVSTWDAPFHQGSKLLVQTSQRFSSIEWGNDTLALVSEQWYDTRNSKTFFFNPNDANPTLRKVFDRNYQDIYSDPGNFETKRNQYGREVLAIENGKLYLKGEGHTLKGQFPFIDEMDIASLKTKRIYQSVYKDKLENISDIVDVNKGLVLVSIQSATAYPNYYLRNIKKKESLIPITKFKNPFESIKNVHKEVIKYQRKDGVALSGTLYLPAGYDFKKKEKLPLLIWAYPAEYKDKNSAGQSTHNSNQFTFPYYGSFVYWVTRGYAVLDDASFPIIGEGTTEPNDHFIEQLTANAAAAIDAVDQLGYIDRGKVAVGGHSYGAFMTANLLTHTKLFACGIARSGAYNRTLTPFGFQSEQRNYWEVPEVYNTMSPFMTANKMKTPLLLVHGEADNNPGTFTLQTERYFQALKGLGATVRMVLLPKESHSYVAKENILHLLWEQDQFLEKYLKGK